MKATLAGLAAAIAITATPAFAQQQPQVIGEGGFKNINITGTVRGGGAFNALFDITRFEARGNRVWAVGVLHGGTLGQQTAEIALPVSGKNGKGGRGGGHDDRDDDRGGFGALQKAPSSAPASLQQQSPFGSMVIPAQAACPVLDLVLGPLDLNLLGLRVQLNQVNLDITAVPGAGNLLGNLLCAVLGLLDGLNLNALLAGLLANLLNAIAAALTGLPI
jgi:hypothetical protein